MYAIKRSNKKRYKILSVTSQDGVECIEYQALNPKTGAPWQRIRYGTGDEFTYEPQEARIK